MATQAITGGYRMWQPVGPARRSTRKWGGVTPEIYFNKAIHNSRLVKVADPKRAREVAMFSVSLAVLFLFTMMYAWQHLRSIEYGEKIEAQPIERDVMTDQHRALRSQ